MQQDKQNPTVEGNLSRISVSFAQPKGDNTFNTQTALQQQPFMASLTTDSSSPY